MEVEVSGNLMRVQFSSNVAPVFVEKRNADFIWYGADNNYPAFLLDLYRKHPIHGAIVKTKVKYVYGKGLSLKEGGSVIELAKGQAFLSAANRYEDWNSVYKKTVRSLEVFNGFCWQIIWDIFGRTCEVYCLQLSKCRVSEDRKKVFYCNKWVNDKGEALSKTELLKNGYTEFDAFDPDHRQGTQIYYYIVEDQTAEEYNCYPRPEYEQILVEIDTDIAISVFRHSLVGNGMSAQGMLSLFNGNPTDEEKRKIKKQFETKYSGPNKAGSIIFNFVDSGPDSKGAEWTTFTVSDMDKQFDSMTKSNQENIISGHQIPNKSLIGISVEGALSDRTAILESHEQLQNTYTQHRQDLILPEIKKIAAMQGISLPLEVQKLSPLGVDITNPDVAQYFDEDEIREKLGYKPREKKIDPSAPVMPEAQINEHLKNITGRQWQNIKRLQREVKSKKTDRKVAAMILKNSYNLTDEDISVLLPENDQLFTTAFQFSEQLGADKANDYVFGLFEALAVSDNEGDTFVSEEPLEFATQRDTKNNILDLLKGDPTISVEKMAKILDVESDFIKEVLDDLIDRGLIVKSTGKLTPTDKGIDRKTPIVETEIYTVYKYSLRDDVPELKGGRSREFCQKMMRLTAEGKRWTREAIDQISNAIGENAWSYRGGWYTDPNTGKVTTFCRHVWKAITRSRTRNNG